jgi:hypothetical protein
MLCNVSLGPKPASCEGRILSLVLAERGDDLADHHLGLVRPTAESPPTRS